VSVLISSGCSEKCRKGLHSSKMLEELGQNIIGARLLGVGLRRVGKECILFRALR
jgi:hypothetical protein